MTIEIIRLSADNASLLNKVAEDVFDADIVAARLAAYLAHETNLMVVAVADGLVVGQVAACIHRHPDQATELYVDNLGVAPDFRRQGIARRLIETMLDLGRSLGCEEWWVGTEEDNLPARSLYETFGDTGVLAAFYEYDLD
jgi:ribosomal protein S18 acetylase RimI-like enzyme